MPLIKYNNNSLSSITALPASIPTGKLKLISSQTASNSASISFTSGLNSTYKVYKFVFVNCHPRTDNVQLQFQGSTNGGSSYGLTITSTAFYSTHDEADTDTGLGYSSGSDLAQQTIYQNLVSSVGNDADQNVSGSMLLYNPSSTTYVKHFITNSNSYNSTDYSVEWHNAGYFNTTSAINAIQFKMSSGNFDGTIYLYAIDNS
jgi:hypothetical protein